MSSSNPLSWSRRYEGGGRSLIRADSEVISRSTKVLLGGRGIAQVGSITPTERLSKLFGGPKRSCGRDLSRQRRGGTEPYLIKVGVRGGVSSMTTIRFL